MERKKKACFFARVKDKRLLSLVQWYKNDIQILKDLGYEVRIATRFSEIPLNVDLYFSWWATSSIFPLIVAKIARKPVAVVAGGSEVVHLEKEPTAAGFLNKSFITRQVIKYCLRHATVVISVSHSIKQEADDLGARNSQVIYPGIDTRLYSPIQSQNRDIIFTISHLTEENIARKRILTVVDAARYVVQNHPEQKFVIAGGISTAIKKVKEKIANNGLENNIYLPGRISEAGKRSYFSKSLIYLQPTIHEGFGVAIAEAMSCGIPVVTSKVAAVPEVVGDCGLYANPNDPKDVADKIELLLGDDSLREELSKKGRERIINNFSYTIRKTMIKDLLEKVCGKKRGTFVDCGNRRNSPGTR